MSSRYTYNVEWSNGYPLGTAYNVKDARDLADRFDPPPWSCGRPRVVILREGREGRVTAVQRYPGGPT